MGINHNIINRRPAGSTLECSGGLDGRTMELLRCTCRSHSYLPMSCAPRFSSSASTSVRDSASSIVFLNPSLEVWNGVPPDLWESLVGHFVVKDHACPLAGDFASWSLSDCRPCTVSVHCSILFFPSGFCAALASTSISSWCFARVAATAAAELPVPRLLLSGPWPASLWARICRASRSS